MANLGNTQNTLAVLHKHQFRLQKKYGQNFLVDANVLNKIVRSAQVGKDDLVLEIGPGIGTMTQYLAESAKAVVAVEIDQTLIPVLEETLAEYSNVTIINADILKIDLTALIEEKSDGRPLKVVANLPYYITTPIIMGLLESKALLGDITVMVQEEVAERMRTGPGSKAYGALSLTVQYYSRPEIVAHVPPNCFLPRPKVGSAVIRLACFQEPPVVVKDEQFLFAVIRASFNQRRKTLVNGLCNAAGLGVSREQILSVLNEMNLSATIRGETLTLEQFAFLSNRLYKAE